jgi:hypothetical protein
VTINLSHRELSLALFALEGGDLPASVEDPCSPDEHACPVVDSLEEMFGARKLTPEKKLARHLSQHLQQGWLECGLMNMGATSGMATEQGATERGATEQGATEQGAARQVDSGQINGEHVGNLAEDTTEEQQVSARRLAESIGKWTCEIELAPEEQRLLFEAIGRLPRSAWISMPRTMWRLRKKLRVDSRLHAGSTGAI